MKLQTIIDLNNMAMQEPGPETNRKSTIFRHDNLPISNKTTINPTPRHPETTNTFLNEVPSQVLRQLPSVEPGDPHDFRTMNVAPCIRQPLLANELTSIYQMEMF